MIALLCSAERLVLDQDRSAATPKDEIFARKILMDAIDSHAEQLDWTLNTASRSISPERLITPTPSR